MIIITDWVTSDSNTCSFISTVFFIYMELKKGLTIVVCLICFFFTFSFSLSLLFFFFILYFQMIWKYKILVSETTIIPLFCPVLKHAATSRLINVNSNDDNVKQACNLLRFYRKEKRSGQILKEIWKRNISDNHHGN